MKPNTVALVAPADRSRTQIARYLRDGGYEVYEAEDLAIASQFVAGLQASVVAEYDHAIDASQFAALMHSTAVISRTNWVNEVCHRYVFERVVCHRHDSCASKFLEVELFKELYFLHMERDERRGRPGVVRAHSALVDSALKRLEQGLFEPLDMARLAHQCGSIQSTQLRAFKRELGMAPAEYLRTRRLDEARLLLKSARYRVSDVAEIVGYHSTSSFTQAFRRRFDDLPSRVRGGGARSTK